MFDFLKRKVVANSGIFDNQYIDAKALYLLNFNAVPSITFATQMDIDKVYAYIKEELAVDVRNVLQHSQFNYEEKRPLFNVTLLVCRSSRILELGNDYIMLYHKSKDFEWANNLLLRMAPFRKVIEVQEKTIGFIRQSAMN